MRTEYIGAYQVPDGYFGDDAIVHLCFDPQTNYCLEVCATGCFRSCVPPTTTKYGAEWLIQNHPTCKGRFKTATK